MKKTLVLTAVMSALLFGTLNANAQVPNGKMMPPPHHHHMQKPLTAEQKAMMEQRKAAMEKRLNITEEQKAQFKAIHEKSKAQIAPKVKQLTEVQHEISVLEKKQINKDIYGINTLENVKLSGKSLDQLKAEEKTLKSDIRAIRKANFEASQNIFTDEQKKELEKMRKEKQDKMKKMHKHGGPGFDKKPPVKK